MSGPNHHFLPRFMLAGFASRRVAKQVWTYEFRRDSPGVERNTSKVGAQRNFYDHEGDQQVDQELQQHEDRFGGLVSQIRLSGTVPDGSGDTVAELVTSLAVRTRALRLALAQAGDRMAAAFGRQFSDASVVRRMVEEQLLLNHDAMLGQISEKLGLRDARDLPQELREKVLQLAEQLLNTPETVERMMQVGAMAVQEIKNRTSKEGMKEIHLKALEKEVIPSRRIELLKDFRWSVLRYPPGSLILGDVGPFRFNQTTGNYESLTNAVEDPQTVLLPVSHEHLIVGTDARVGHHPRLDCEEINVATAELSWEFFVARQSTAREEEYVKALGRRADLLPDDEVQRLEEETFGRFRSGA